MKVIKNDDGSVTVAIPRGPEVYHAEDAGLPNGGLYSTERLSADDWKAQSKPGDRIRLSEEDQAAAIKSANETAARVASENLALEHAAERRTAGQPSNAAIVADAKVKAEGFGSKEVAPDEHLDAARRVAEGPAFVNTEPAPTKADKDKAEATKKADDKAEADRQARTGAKPSERTVEHTIVEKKASDSGSGVDKKG